MTDPNQRLSRRRFMGKFSTALMAALAAQLLPRMVQAGAEAGGTAAALHYRPLNGDSLREMARRKMHHGSDIFLNPMGVPRDKRFWQVLSWKLFHKNAYHNFIFQGTALTLMDSNSWPTILTSTWPSSTWVPMRRAGSWRPAT